MRNNRTSPTGTGAGRQVRLQVEELETRDLPSSTLPVTETGAYAADHIIVRFNSAPAATPLSTGDVSLGNNTYDVDLAPGVTVAQAVSYYSSLAAVNFAQPDYILTDASVSATPNDPYYSYEWALTNINAMAAWKITTGGNRILVAEIDTGVAADTDLAANLVTGYNFITGTTNTTDANGHGTNVAGIIGAVGNNGIGVAGLDWNVEIMPLVFLDSSGSGLLSNAVAAVNYAVAAGAKIINNSWGGGGYDAAMESAIQNAQAHGVIFVAAAGNNSSDNDTTPEYPASYTGSNVVSVEATDQNNNLASFSDYGTSVSIAAPGVSILSTGLNNTYSYYSGTSQATPFVTGALALVWSIEPTWTYSQVIADVLNNTDKIASLTGKVETGLLDVGKAVAAAEAALPKAPSPTQPAPITSSGVTTVSSGNVNLAVPALQTTTSTITVNQNISISNLTVTVNLKDTYDSAVNISLVSPSGQTILLFNHRGGAGQNLTNTTFSDSSPNAIYLAAAPFSESVRPEYSLSPLTNTNAYGTWKLVITDIAKGTSATLVNWSLNITAATSSTAGRTTSVAGEFFGTLAQTPPADAANSQAAANSSAAAWLFAPSNAIVISNSGSAGSSAPKWSKSDSPNWSISFVDRPGFTPFAGDDDFGNESPDWAE